MSTPTPEQKAEFKRLVTTCIADEEKGDDAALDQHMTELVQFAQSHGISINAVELAYTAFKHGLAS